MKRTRQIALLLHLLVFLKECYADSDTSQESWPEERGIMAALYFEDYDDFGDVKSKLIHIPVYPGYEDVPGSMDDGYMTPDAPMFSFPNGRSLMKTIDLDYRSKTFYVYDNEKSAIAMGTGYNKNLNMEGTNIKNIHAAVSRGNVHIAVDWVSHMVYWTDPMFLWVVAAPGQIDMVDMDYYKIIATNLEVPTGLALDPIEGIMCWSENSDNPKIECSDLLGGQRHTIIHKYLKDITALKMDVSSKRIYWVELRSDTILSANYDGSDPDSFVWVPRTSFYDMAIFREVLYLTDTYNDYIYVLNKTTGVAVVEPLMIPSHIPYGIAVYGEETQPVPDTDYCSQKNCDHFCISKKSGATCACSEGFKLDGITGKCTQNDAGYYKAIAFANATHVCLVDIRAFTGHFFNHKCAFSVIKPKQDHSTSAADRNKRDVSASPAGTPSPTTAKQLQNTTTSTTTTLPTTTTTLPTTTTTLPTTTTTLVPPGDKITRFDMDMKNRILFIATADNSVYKRPIDLPIENGTKELIVRASGNISGIAYDAENPNYLFWCESDTGHVRVINTVTRVTATVTKNDQIDNVRDIKVLLNKRLLAVIAGTDGDMSIKTISMDGEEFNDVVSRSSKIQAFTYDGEKEMFYYISGSNVHRASLDGSKKGVELTGVDANAFVLVFYQHYAMWVYQNETHAHVVRSRDIVTNEDIDEPWYYGDSVIVDMKILDMDLQSSEHISPCAVNNGGCSHLCVNKYDNTILKKVCECPLGYTLKNGVNCTTAVVEDNFILVTDWTDEEILQIDLETNEIHVVPGDESASYMGVFFDSQTRKVNYAEYFGSEIVAKNLNGTDRHVLTDLGWSGYAYRFAKDMSTGNLYFTAYYFTFIGVVTPFGEYLTLNDNLGWSTLTDIVVHPREGWMFYIVTSTSYPWYIGRSNMDGSDPVKLISADNFQTADGLAIDYINDRLFWSSGPDDTIQMCNLDGLDCITIVNNTASDIALEDIRDLETDGDYLYYCSYSRNYIARIELARPYRKTIIGQNYGLGRIDSIAFYSSKSRNIQPASFACQDRGGLGDCSTICLPSHSGRTCACETGVDLKPDGRTCSNVYLCTDVLYQDVPLLTGTKETVAVTIDKTCTRYLDDTCRYKCPSNFKPRFKNLTCTNVGWNFELEILCEEFRCPQSIKNGVLANSCKREVGEKCEYECKSGFVKTEEYAVCMNTATYHKSDGELCAPYKCDDKVGNGLLDSTCNRTVGSSCKYTCNEFFTSAQDNSEVVCKIGGWSPEPDELCKESLCDDSSFGNGSLLSSCQMTIGEECMFQCNEGFVKTTDTAYCRSDKKWHPADSCIPYTCGEMVANGLLVQGCPRSLGSVCNYTCNKYYTPSVPSKQVTCEADGWNPATKDLCQAIKCPSSIPNGEIIDCDLTAGITCNYKCNSGYVRADGHPNITCKYNGVWFNEELCLESTPEKYELSVPGVGAGFGVLAFVTIILIIVIVVFVRKNRSSKYKTFDDRGVSVENEDFGRRQSQTRAESSYPDLKPVSELTPDAPVINDSNM